MKLFYVSIERGGCGIRAARTLASARKRLADEIGKNNIAEVREATEADVAYVRGMGGFVPDGVTKKP